MDQGGRTDVRQPFGCNDNRSVAQVMSKRKKPSGYDPEKHCGGTKKTDGKPCKLPKGWGTDHIGFGHCRKCLGSTANHRKAAEIEKARSACARLGYPVATDPFAALYEGLAELNGYVEYYRRLVQELDPAMRFVRPTSILRRPLDEGSEGENPGVEVEETTEGPIELNIAIKLHWEAIEHRRRTAKTIADLGLAERMASIQEKRSQLFATAISGIVAALGHDLKDARIERIIRKELMTINGTATEVA